MSCYGAGSTTRLSYITETTRGTTPVGDFTLLPYATHTLGLGKEEITDPTLYGDRQERNTRHGNRMVSGDIAAPFRADNYDDFLESVMLSTWDSSPVASPDVLKLGNTLKTFSIEDYDSTTDFSLVYTACTVNNASFSTTVNSNIDTTFSMLGFDLTPPTQTEKTVASTTIREPSDNFSGTIEIGDTGGSLTESAIVTSIDFNITNNLTATYNIGSPVANCFVPNIAEVTGTLTVFYKDAALINRFLNETESAINFTVNDSSGLREYGFLFPRVKFTGSTPTVEGGGERLIQLPFRALRDSVEQSSIVISRPDSNA